MKKVISVILSLCLVVSSVAAMAEGFTPAASYDVGERTYNAGAVTTNAASVTGGEVTSDIYAGTPGKDYTDEAVYTYRSAVGNITSSMIWDPLSWETNEDSAILDYITTGFYSFVPNSTLTGYSVSCDAAAAYPVDVTADYVGSYGVEEGETAKAWRIALNPDMCFDDGTKITADDYVYSMQQQLNPKMLNRRADSYYDGDFSIVNAKKYLYAGGTAYSLLDGTEEEGTELYLDMGFWGVVGAPDADGNPAPQYVAVTNDVMYRDAAVEDETADEAWVSAKYLYDNYLAAGAPYESYAAEYIYKQVTMDSATWDEVGFKKVDDYTIDIILENPIAEAAFYLPYNMSSTALVKKDVYEACKSFFNADGKPVETEEEAATVTTTYNRTLDTTVSYGPYKLTYFELDKQYVLSRNENWYGYHDGKHLGMYQTDVIEANVIVEHATEVLAFEKGELDEVGLQAADMDKYASSSYIMYTPQTYTTKISFNTDYDKLVARGTNSQVLVVDEFRKAFAFALDRKHFAAAYTAAHQAGFGMLNYLYCYDPFTGETYRDSDSAKEALLRTYGLTYGEGTDYATLDEAYEAMTGYDMNAARELMAVAYDKAVAAGIYDGQSDITIEFRVYNSDTIYVQMITYLDEQLKQACVGTGFEGKVSLKLTVDADYYNTNYSGGADAIYTTWGGAAMSPFSVLYQCYCDGSDGSGNQMEYGYDTSKIMVTFTVDGTELTDTLQNWASWANNGEIKTLNDAIGNFTDYDYPTRCTFFAGMEAAFLNWYTTTPVYYRNSASLHSQKIEYASYNFNSMTGFGGGFTFMTYNYDDAAWTEYITNNTLQY